MVIYFKLSYLDRTKMIILGVILKNNKQNKTNNKHISFRGSSVMWLFKNKYTNTHTHSPNIQKSIYSEYPSFTES